MGDWVPLVPNESFFLLTFSFQKMRENGEEEEENLVALRTSREEEQEQVSSQNSVLGVLT